MNIGKRILLKVLKRFGSMKEKLFPLTNRGMNRDLSISKVGESSAYENHNIRITARDHDTLLSITNERGNRKISLTGDYWGELIGWNTLGNHIILFTTGTEGPQSDESPYTDHIFRVDLESNGSFTLVNLYNGELGFSIENPIESVVYYETEDIQKIYWVDGEHVLRSMNFMASQSEIASWATDSANGKYDVFDSSRVSKLDVEVSVKKDYTGNTRDNGITQYILTYFNKYGVETGCVWMSDIVYLSPKGKGGSPDGTNTCCITITLDNLDTRFTNFRVYSIFRASLNSEPSAYLVGEYEVPADETNEVYVIDDGSHLSAEDPSRLMYLGSQSVKAGTLGHKDGTLFLGDLRSIGKANYKSIADTLQSMFSGSTCRYIDFVYSNDSDSSKDIPDIDYDADSGTYTYNSQLELSSSNITGFKGGEKYRFGLKFQLGDGTETETFWIGDKVNNKYPVIDVITGKIRRVVAKCSLQVDVIAKMRELGFKTVQLMIAEASDADRAVKAQGILNPTMFNVWERYNDGLYAIPSWISRPRNSGFSWKHFSPVRKATSSFGEIACNYWDSDKEPTPYFRYKNYDNTEQSEIQYMDDLEGRPEFNDVMSVYSIYVTGTKPARAYIQIWVFQIRVISESSSAEANALTQLIDVSNLISWWGAKRDVPIFSNNDYEIYVKTYGTDCTPCALEDLEKVVAKQKATLTEDTFQVPESALANANTLYRWIQLQDASGAPKYGFFNPKYEGRLSGCSDNNALNAWVPNSAAVNYVDGGSSPAASRWYPSVSNVQTDSLYAPAYYKKHLMFVDENILTLNSPEIELGAASVDKADYKLRIVGAAKLSSVISDYTVDASHGHLTDTNLDRVNFSAHVPSPIDGLISWPLWIENGLTDDSENPESDIDKRTSKNYSWGSTIVRYMLHLWERSGKITGFTGDDDNEDYSTLRTKTFANLRYAYHTIYGVPPEATPHKYEYSLDSLRLFNQPSSRYTEITIGDDRRFYDGIIDTSLLVPGEMKYPIPYIDYAPEAGKEVETSSYFLRSTDPIQLQYASNPHAVLALHSGIVGGKYQQTILPYLFDSEKPVIPERNTSLKETGALLPWINSTAVALNYIKHLDDGEVPIPDPMPTDFTVTKAYDPVSNTISLRGSFTHQSDVEALIRGLRKHSGDLYIRAVTYVTEEGVQHPDTYYFVCINNATSSGSDIILANAKVGARYKAGESLSNDRYVLVNKHYWYIDEEELPAYAVITAFGGNAVLDITSGLYVSGGYGYTDYEVAQQRYDFGDLTNWSEILSNSHRANILEGEQYILIGELFRDFTGKEYGGTDQSAIATNRFIKAGPRYRVEDFPYDDEGSIYGNEGDTFFQRWDCVKTKPYADDSVNNVVDIMSVMLESHINLDGRYDSQRGLNKIASLNLEEFGEINPVYSQKDNFFVSRDLPEDFDLDSYRSSLTWTLPKADMASIDEWSHITLASTLKLDGDRGTCNAIRRYKNSILAFQDKGIAEILFNSRTQLSTTDGVPVEIGNTGKVDGKRYLSNKYGCINKWSVIEGKAGLYFVDDTNNCFCGAGFNRNGILEIESISTKLGFDVWFRERCKNYPWKPVTGDNIISFYDKVHSDVYLVGPSSPSNPCLVYNEQLGVFTSFFDYGSVPMMTNVQDRFISYKNSSLWLQNEGFYGRFFGNQYDFWVTYRVTPSPYSDKIWTNIEYQADVYQVLTVTGASGVTESQLINGESAGTYQPDKTFDSIRVWNEYQDTVTRTSTPIKKFRRWRYTIPRADKSSNNKYGLDRIRNPWVNIKFAKHTDTNDRNMMQIHDIIVKYYE